MFNRATIKLAIQYTVLVLGLFWLVSLSVYLYMDRSFGGDYLQGISSGANILPNGADDRHSTGVDEAADASLDRLKTGLIALNAGLLLLVPLASYWLARSTLKPIQKSYEAQQEFADNASHELRTPLAVLSGELELALMKPRSPKEYRETIQAGVRETQVLTGLVSELLMLARNDDTALRAGFEHVQLDKIVEDVIARYQPIAKTKDVKLTVHATTAWTLGKEILLSQAISNVVDNAIKFSSPGGTVEIMLVRPAGHVQVEVNDQGTGMSPHEYSQAFDRFWRSETSRTSAGHGLGLAVARRIVTLHGGQISLTPRKGGGTRATILLTIADADKA